MPSDASFPVLHDCCNFTKETIFCIATQMLDFNIFIVLALQFFLRSKDKCKMLTKMLTLSKLHQIETSSLAGTRVQVMSNKNRNKIG